MSTRPSPKLRPTLWDAVAAAVILAAALGLTLYFRSAAAGGGPLTAVVSVDGRETERIALASLSGQEERTITGNGYTLHLILTSDGARMADADCPTQDCVHTGTVRRAGQSIVCLPARVVVELTGGGEGGVDAVLG